MSLPDARVDGEGDSEFDREIRLAEDASGGYAGTFGTGFTIGGGVNGGVLLAATAAGMARSLEPSGHTQPVTVSAAYLTAARPGSFRVETDLVRRGGSSSVVRGMLTQDEARVTALATFGAPATAPSRRDAPAPGHPAVTRTIPLPDIPPVDQCLPRPERRGTGAGWLAPGDPGAPGPEALMPEGSVARPTSVEMPDRLDLRLDPACAGFASGRPSGRGVIQGWIRLADDREPDPLLLLFMVDALPPVTFDLGMPGWAPTVELTAYVRGVPAPGWLCVRHEGRHVAGGHVEEDALVWDSTGTLVAQSRQLARLPRAAR